MTHILDFKNIRKYKSDLPPSGLVQPKNRLEPSVGITNQGPFETEKCLKN